jgi:maleylpyruvate isomerase
VTFRLHTRYQNSAGQRVRIVLNLKSISYEYVPVTSVSSEAYKAINPQGLMPALEIEGRVIAQSMAIIELLEELHPYPSIFPADPVQRAEVRAFANLICADLHPINNRRIRRYLVDPIGATDDQVQDWYTHWVHTALSSLEEQLQDRQSSGPFCFGDHPTLADACLVPQLDNARRFNVDLAAFPGLLTADAACRELDAFQRAAPEAQPDFPHNPV